MSESFQKKTPAWSVVIPVHNCAHYLPATINSVVSASYPETRMQIAVVDDCSTDADIQLLVSELGKGRIEYYRNHKNSGSSTKNFNRCLSVCRGKYIHILHGDDWISPRFYGLAEEAFDNHDVGMVFSRTLNYDNRGELLSLSPSPENISKTRHISDPAWLWYGNCIRTPSVAVRSQVYKSVGDFNESFKHVADWEMWERIIGEWGSFYINEPLAHYREHGSSETNRFGREGVWVDEWNRLADIFQARRINFRRSDFDNLIRDHAANLLGIFKSKNDSNAVAICQGILRNCNSPQDADLLLLYRKVRSWICDRFNHSNK